MNMNELSNIVEVKKETENTGKGFAPTRTPIGVWSATQRMKDVAIWYLETGNLNECCRRFNGKYYSTGKHSICPETVKRWLKSPLLRSWLEESKDRLSYAENVNLTHFKAILGRRLETIRGKVEKNEDLGKSEVSILDMVGKVTGAYQDKPNTINNTQINFTQMDGTV